MQNRCAAYFAALECQPESPPPPPEFGYPAWLVLALCAAWCFIGYAAALARL